MKSQTIQSNSQLKDNQISKNTADSHINSKFIQDEFSDESFLANVSARPYCQIVNNKSKYGLFISDGNVDLSGMSLDSSSSDILKPFTLQLSSGEDIDGFKIINPKMLIVRKTPLFMVDKRTESVAAFNKAVYLENKEHFKLKTKYLIFLLDEKNQPLNSVPIQFTASGAAGASFSEELRKFRLQFDKFFNNLRGEPNTKQRNDKFHSLTVFCPVFKPTEKGEERKSWVCSTVGYAEPDSENWKSLFVGYDEPVKQLAFKAHEDNVAFERISTEPAEPSLEEEMIF